MAQKIKKSAEELKKDEQLMKANYQLMLQLGMVEMVHDLDLLQPPAPQTESKLDTKTEVKK